MKRFWLHYCVAAAVLVLSITAVYGLTYLIGRPMQAAPLRQPLADFPHQIGPWRSKGEEDPMGSEVRIILDPVEAVNRVYGRKLSADRQVHVSLFVGYFARVSKALKHPPKICLPSQGWTQIEADDIMIDPEGRAKKGLSPLKVQRLLFRRGETEEFLLVLYWIDSAGGAGASSMWIKLTNSLSEFRRFAGSPKASWAAKLMVTMSVNGSGDRPAIEAAEQFVAEAEPVLAGEFFPGEDSDVKGRTRSDATE
jgi:EpsI family protein